MIARTTNLTAILSGGACLPAFGAALTCVLIGLGAAASAGATERSCAGARVAARGGPGGELVA